MRTLTEAQANAILKTCKEYLIKSAAASGWKISKRTISSYWTQTNTVTNLREVFEVFVVSLQNSSMMPSAIKLDKINKRFLLRFSPKRIRATYGENDAKLRRAIKKDNPQSKVNGILWSRFIGGITDGARWMSQFKDFSSFKRYLAHFSKLGSNGADLLARTIGDGRIRGMRFALAMNFLKELGLPISKQCVKPDVHIIKTMQSLDLCGKPCSNEDAVEAIRRIAQLSRPKMTPFAVDKLIWLANSGFFYNHKPRLWESSQTAKHRKQLVRQILRSFRKQR